MKTLTVLFDEYIASLYPGLQPNSKQWRSLYHAYYIGVRSVGYQVNAAMKSALEAKSDPSQAAMAAFNRTQDEAADVVRPRVIAPEPIVKLQ